MSSTAASTSAAAAAAAAPGSLFLDLEPILLYNVIKAYIGSFDNICKVLARLNKDHKCHFLRLLYDFGRNGDPHSIGYSVLKNVKCFDLMDTSNQGTWNAHLKVFERKNYLPGLELFRLNNPNNYKFTIGGLALVLGNGKVLKYAIENCLLDAFSELFIVIEDVNDTASTKAAIKAGMRKVSKVMNDAVFDEDFPLYVDHDDDDDYDDYHDDEDDYMMHHDNVDRMAENAVGTGCINVVEYLIGRWGNSLNLDSLICEYAIPYGDIDIVKIFCTCKNSYWSSYETSECFKSFGHDDKDLINMIVDLKLPISSLDKNKILKCPSISEEDKKRISEMIENE